VCARLEAWRLDIPLHRAETFGTELSTARKEPGALEGLAPVSLHSLGEKALEDAKAVREALSRIRVDAAQPGEDDVQSSLVADDPQMAALDESWVQKLQASDVRVESVADLMKRTDALAGKIMLNAAKMSDRCRAVAAAPSDGG
jgi:hypothetical protein